MSVINVLLIDDDKDNYDSLKNRAARNNVLLHFKDNLQEGMEELKSNSKIDGVILDGKAFLVPGQQRGTEGPNFVHEALTQIKLIEKEQERVIPTCVLTAWYDQLKDSLEGRTTVYDKKKVSLNDKMIAEMFSNLSREIESIETVQLKRKYHDVFAVTEQKYFPMLAIDGKLTAIYGLVEKGLIKQNDFNTIREVLETILLRANTIDKNLIPDDLIKADGRPNLEWCNRYIAGLPTEVKNGLTVINSYSKKAALAPDHICRSIEYVKNISSIYSHSYSSSWTNLSYKSVALALGEILIWFKQYIDNNYPHI